MPAKPMQANQNLSLEMSQGYEIKMLTTTNHSQVGFKLQQTNQTSFLSLLLHLLCVAFPLSLVEEHPWPLLVWRCLVEINFCSNKILKILICFSLTFNSIDILIYKVISFMKTFEIEKKYLITFLQNQVRSLHIYAIQLYNLDVFIFSSSFLLFGQTIHIRLVD